MSEIARTRTVLPRQVCVGCDALSAQAVVVRRKDPGSGAVRALYACHACAPDWPDEATAWNEFLDHSVTCQDCQRGECAMNGVLYRVYRAAQRRTEP